MAPQRTAARQGRPAPVRSLPASAALAIAVLAVLPAGAAAQPASSGTFSISPARRDAVARPPALLSATRVANTTSFAFRVSAFPALLVQQLDGSFSFSEQPADLAAARRLLRVAPTRFVLPPGENRDLEVRWTSVARGARGAYVALVVVGTPVVRGSSGVVALGRLVQVNLLRLPGPSGARGALVGLRGEQATRGRLRFFSRVRNTGTSYAGPRRTDFSIADSSGRTVFAAHWASGIVLPGFDREFPVDVARVLPAGTYRATSTMIFGRSRRSRIATDFTLVGPNKLPTAKLDLRRLDASGEIGASAYVKTTVKSVGTAAAEPTVRVALYRLRAGVQDQQPVAVEQARGHRLAIGARQKLELKLGKLRAGSYRVVATVAAGPAVFNQLTSDFVATHHRSFANRVGDFVSGNFWLLVAIAELGVIAVLATRLKRQRAG